MVATIVKPSADAARFKLVTKFVVASSASKASATPITVFDVADPLAAPL